jgi:hypothetical protein
MQIDRYGKILAEMRDFEGLQHKERREGAFRRDAEMGGRAARATHDAFSLCDLCVSLVKEFFIRLRRAGAAVWLF